MLRITYTRVCLDLVRQDHRDIEFLGDLLETSEELVEFLAVSAWLLDVTYLLALGQLAAARVVLAWRS